MSLALLVLAAIAVVNPARVRSALRDHDAPFVGGVGAVLAWVALVPVAAGAGPLLAQVDIESSTLRMAAGVVLLLQGAVVALTAPPRPEPSLPGRRAALVPVAFPVTLTPGLGLLTLAAAADRSAPVALVVLAGALASIPIVALARPTVSAVRARVLAGLGRLTAATLALSGVGLLMNGLFDI